VNWDNLFAFEWDQLLFFQVEFKAAVCFYSDLHSVVAMDSKPFPRNFQGSCKIIPRIPILLNDSWSHPIVADSFHPYNSPVNM
jgi:hypothetical protein